MAGAYGRLVNCQRALKESLGCRVFALLDVQGSQVVEAVCDLRVAGAESFFLDRKRTQIHGLRLRIFALIAVCRSQGIGDVADVRVAWAQRLLQDRESTLQEPFRRLILALLSEHVGQIVQGLRHTEGARALLIDCKNALKSRLR